MQSYYSIHDVVSLKLKHEKQWTDAFFRNRDIELKDFPANNLSAPDIIVTTGKFTPQIDGCTVLDNKFYIKEDYLYCEDSLYRAHWKLELSGFESGKIEARIQTNLWGRTLVTELLIFPLIWFVVNSKGYPVIHASGVAKDGRATVFAGRGAAGKSTIAINLVSRGYSILGDHFVMLHQGRVFSFLSPLHLMDFNMHPVIWDNMKPEMKRALRLRQLFHKITGRRLATKISLMDILPEAVVNEAELDSLFIVIPGEKYETNEISKEEAFRRLVLNQKLEAPHFDKYILEYACLFPESKLAGYWTRYEENLRRAFNKNIDTYLVETPHRLDTETIDSIYRGCFDERLT